MIRKTGIVIALCCAFVLAEDSNINSVPVQPPPSPSPAPPTISPTPPPKTTSIAPTTHPTTSTTQGPAPLPSTTTEPPITPLPPPAKGHYIIKSGNDTCIIADFAVQVMFVAENKTWNFDVPANASIDKESSCNNETQDLALSWEDEKEGTVFFTFQFIKDNSSKRYRVSQLILTVPQNHSQHINLTAVSLFTTSVSKSYRCEKEQEIKLTEEATNTTYAVLKISQIRLEAFHTSGDDKFSAAEDCAGSSSPDVVPIAVGCALVGLIAIVLIAYLVGRRRSQARGYLSM